MEKNSEQKPFIEKEFNEVSDGYYDKYGFYYTPNGSNLKL